MHCTAHESAQSIDALKVQIEQALPWICVSLDGTSTTEEDRKRCCALVKANLMDYYVKSSWGWQDQTKWDQMSHTDSQFVLLRHRESAQILGFMSFRFEEEEAGEEVIYCYEIQLSEALRRQSIGRHLMQMLEYLGKEHGSQRAMLTCFTANQAAMQFYLGIGYNTDPTSPKDRLLRGRKVSADYMILSKHL